MAAVVAEPDAAPPAAAVKANKFVRFDWEDPFNLDGQLTQEERMVRDSARAYCQQELLPRVTMANRNELHDPMLLKEMGELGLLGPTIQGHGCAGLGSVPSRAHVVLPSAALVSRGHRQRNRPRRHDVSSM